MFYVRYLFGRSHGFSSLFVLSKNDLNEAIRYYPNAQKILKQKARRVRQYSSTYYSNRLSFKKFGNAVRIDAQADRGDQTAPNESQDAL